MNALAVRIEEEIFEANNKSTDNNYRSSIRSHVLNLKDEKTALREHLLNSELSPESFARMSGKVYVLACILDFVRLIL